MAGRRTFRILASSQPSGIGQLSGISQPSGTALHHDAEIKGHLHFIYSFI
jgi:hypothetical protein